MFQNVAHSFHFENRDHFQAESVNSHVDILLIDTVSN